VAIGGCVLRLLQELSGDGDRLPCEVWAAMRGVTDGGAGGGRDARAFAALADAGGLSLADIGSLVLGATAARNACVLVRDADGRADEGGAPPVLLWDELLAGCPAASGASPLTVMATLERACAPAWAT